MGQAAAGDRLPHVGSASHPRRLGVLVLQSRFNRWRRRKPAASVARTPTNQTRKEIASLDIMLGIFAGFATDLILVAAGA